MCVCVLVYHIKARHPAAVSHYRQRSPSGIAPLRHELNYQWVSPSENHRVRSQTQPGSSAVKQGTTWLIVGLLNDLLILLLLFDRLDSVGHALAISAVRVKLAYWHIQKLDVTKGQWIYFISSCMLEYPPTIINNYMSYMWNHPGEKKSSPHIPHAVVTATACHLVELIDWSFTYGSDAENRFLRLHSRVQTDGSVALMECGAQEMTHTA